MGQAVPAQHPLSSRDRDSTCCQPCWRPIAVIGLTVAVVTPLGPTHGWKE